MKFSGRIFLIFIIAAGISQAQREEIPLGFEEKPNIYNSYIPYYNVRSPQIALALSGGGARGLAQIGVLKVFEKNGIPISGIVGTSMGAIIGGLYAIGYSAGDLDSLAHQIAWNEIIRDTPPRRQLFLAEKEERSRYLFQLRFQGFSIDIQSALTSGIQFNQLLSALVSKAPYPVSRDFDRLVIPFRAVTTDLLSGKKVVLSSGSLIEALRASMAIPLLFTPVKTEDAWLVDGGLVQNLPVDDARQLQCDLVIAVDTSAKLRSTEYLNAPWEVADQATTIMAQESIHIQLQKADIGIQPQLENLSNTDFSKIDAFIEAGEAAAENAIPRIEQLLSQWNPQIPEQSYYIESIVVSGCRYRSPDDYLKRLGLNIHREISVQEIQKAAQQLYESRLLSSIRAFYNRNGNVLSIELEETPFIRDIQISGNKEFPDSLLFSMIETRPNQYIDIDLGRKDLRRLQAFYQQSGFSLAHIHPTITQNRTLNIHIDEGRIESIWIRGHQISKPFVIRREIEIKQGELFNIDKLNQSIQNIYSTGYFEDVRFEVVPLEENYRLIIHVTEYQYSLVRLGLRYDLERQSRGFLEIVHDNIWGIGGEGTLTGLFGPKDSQIKAILRADRLYTSYLTSKLEFGIDQSAYNHYVNYQRRGEYTLSRIYGIFGAGRQMQRLGALSIELRSELFKVEPDPSLTVKPDKKFIQTICIRSEVDTRDRVPFPNRGKYHRLEYETSAKFLGSEVDFLRLSSWMESVYPVSRWLVFHPRFFWGTSGLATPFPKQFRMGGMDNFMGLPDDIWIGKRSLLLSSALRWRLPCKEWAEAYLSIRYDFGGIWEKYAKINQDDFKHGIGAILSVNTLLGPLHLGAGRVSDGHYQYYFSYGYTF